MQRKLLNSTFNMIKKEAPGSGKGLGIENVFYYNIQDYIDESHTTWDYRAGLREEEGHGEGGRYREAWYAFQDQTGYEGKYP